ncbi:hypothetical protein K8R47_01430 [archaeon]|nr:hypothetical protein [archaeon]
MSSALMLGMTMGVAAAANYPLPFVSGSTADVAIVYGAGAASSDEVAVGNIQANLNSAMPSTGGTTTVTGENVKFETGTNKLNIGDNLTTIKSVAIDGDDMGIILKSGSYSNSENTAYAYDQKIDLDTRLEYAFFQDSDYNSKQPSLGIRIAKGKPVLNYTLDFTTSAEDDGATTDWTDFEDTTIEILGKTYEIVDAKNATRAEMTFMRGSIKDTLNFQETGTYTVEGIEHTVEVTYVDSSTCKFKVDGVETSKLADGATDEPISGLEIGVTEVDYAIGATTEIMSCEFYLGAEKFKIDSTKQVEINDVIVKKLYGHIEYTSSNPIKLNKIKLEWIADEDVFITETSDLEMPGFGSVKLSGGALVTDTQEEVLIEGKSSDALELTFTIKSGTTTIPILGTNGSSGFQFVGGNGDGEGIITNSTAGPGFIMDLGTNNTGHQYFVATYWDRSSTGESYLVEISDDDDDTGVDFRDAITGADLATNIKNTTSFNIGDTTFYLNTYAEDDYLNISMGGSAGAGGASTYVDRIITKEGLMIYLPMDCQHSAAQCNLTRWNVTTGRTSPEINMSTANNISNGNYVLYMESENRDGTLAGGEDINITLGFESDHDVQVSSIDSSMKTTFSGANYWEDQSNDNLYLAYVKGELGTYVEYDSGANPDNAKIVYHGGQAYGTVVIAESGAVLSTGDGTTTALGNVKVLDSDISSMSSKNLIVVGGSCINAVAANLLGGVAYCEAEWTEKTGAGAGKYIIQSFTSPYSTSKIALLVAGYNAADTTNAQLALIGNTIDTTAGKKYTGTTSSDVVAA